jgi:hypothetical protein
MSRFLSSPARFAGVCLLTAGGLVALACGSSGGVRIQPADLFAVAASSPPITSGFTMDPALAGSPPQSYAARGTEGAGSLPATAATFAIERGEASSVPAEMEPLVASLLERRGWRPAAAGESADVVVVLEDGTLEVARGPVVTSGSAGSGGRDLRFGISSSGGDVLQPVGGTPSGMRPAPGPTIHRHRLGVDLESAGEVAWHGLGWDDTDQDAYLASASRIVAALADVLPAPATPSAERSAIDRLGTDYLVCLTATGALRPIVLAADRGSAVAAAGWKPRDVLVSIGGTDTANLTWSRVASLLAPAEHTPVRVELMRGNESFLTFLVPHDGRRTG